MQLEGNHEDKRETCHSVMVLKRLFQYMFQGEFVVKDKKQQKPIELRKKKELQNFMDIKKGVSMVSPWTMERKNKFNIGK